MADKKLSSSEVFNQAVKPFIDHKKAIDEQQQAKKVLNGKDIQALKLRVTYLEQKHRKK